MHYAAPLKECKDNITKFAKLLGSHKSVGSDGSKDQDLHPAFSHSARAGSRLQHVVKTGTNEGGTRIANIGGRLRNISLLSVKTSHQLKNSIGILNQGRSRVAFSQREREEFEGWIDEVKS